MDLCRNCPFADFTHKNKDLIDIYQYFQSFCIDEENQIFSEEESLRGGIVSVKGIVLFLNVAAMAMNK
jgi:hypothetical protein